MHLGISVRSAEIRERQWKTSRNIRKKPWDWKGINANPNLTMDFVQKNPDKPWDCYLIGNNLFSLHPALRGRFPAVSEELRLLLQELHEKFDMPPMVDERPIFKKGGVGYWEAWNAVEHLGYC